MPIKKDDTGKRWVEMELLVPGTPEEVWHAIATGPGYTGWFVRSEIDARVGGSLTFDFGEGAVSHGEVTAWDPPRRVAYEERDWADGAPPVATEITVTGRDGGQSVVRMVHSLFTSSDEWDDQIESFEKGWPSFFAVLRLYLTHFSGRPAGSFFATAPAAGESIPTWAALCDALGLAGATVGEERTSTLAHDPWTCVIERVYQDNHERYVLARVPSPSPGILFTGTNEAKGKLSDGEVNVGRRPGTNVSVARYYYGDDASERAATAEAAWRAWLKQTFGG